MSSINSKVKRLTQNLKDDIEILYYFFQSLHKSYLKVNEISSRNQNSQWVDWINEWGNRLNRINDSDLKFDDKKTLLKTIIDKIIVKSKDNLQHELSIIFKFLYVNDELI